MRTFSIVKTFKFIIKMNLEPTESENYTQFVNDECGDTMWDKVLAQKETLKIFDATEEQRPLKKRPKTEINHG